MTRALALGAVLALSACGGDGFSKRGAKQVAEATTTLSMATYDKVYWEASAATYDAEDGTFEGTLTWDGPEWTGRMHYQGSYGGDAESASIGLRVDLEEMSDGRTTLDGWLDWDWAVTVHEAGFTLSSSTEGELESSGKPKGSGSIDTLATITVGIMGASAEVSGQVGDHEVDFRMSLGWSF